MRFIFIQSFFYKYTGLQKQLARERERETETERDRERERKRKSKNKNNFAGISCFKFKMPYNIVERSKIDVS